MNAQQAPSLSCELTNEPRFAFIDQGFHSSPCRRIGSGELAINLRLQASINPTAFRSGCQYLKPFHLDDGEYYDLGQPRTHVELVYFSSPGHKNIAPQIQHVQCIKKRSTATKVRGALGSVIFEQ